MKSRIFLVLVSTLFIQCNDGLSSRENYSVELEIITSAEIPSPLDFTYYQHDPSWKGDSVAVDSAILVLAASGLTVTDNWYPHWPSECGTVTTPGRQFLIKQRHKAPSISKFNFIPYQEHSYPFACNKYWRHYRIIRK